MTKPEKVVSELTERDEVKLSFNSADSMLHFVREVSQRAKQGWKVVGATLVFERRRIIGGSAWPQAPRKGAKR